MSHEVWYCDTSRDHIHQSLWEAENCTELYERYLDAMAHLIAYAREAEVEEAVNLTLMESNSDDIMAQWMQEHGWMDQSDDSEEEE
jgi:hypothetical protein